MPKGAQIASLLLNVHRNAGRIQRESYPLLSFDSFRLGGQLSIKRRIAGEIRFLGANARIDGLNRIDEFDRQEMFR